MGSRKRRRAATVGRTILVMPDVHLPYHDPEAVAVFLAVAKKIKPAALVIIGDLVDCYSVSRYGKNPERMLRLKDELDASIEVLDQISALKIPLVYMTEGNHEVRLEVMIANQAPALHGLISVRDLLDVDGRGWHWTPYKRSLQLGKMRYSHDFGRSGVNAARQGLVDVASNICFGHTHRLGIAYQGTIAGGAHVAINVGHLSDIKQIDYAHRDRAARDWQLGFGLVDEAPNGLVWPQAIAIVKGAAMVRGQRVTA